MGRAKNQKEPDSFLTLPEVQTFLGIKSRKTILKYIHAGKLPAYKIGGTRWRFAFNDVHAFLKKELISIADTPASHSALNPPAENPGKART